MDVCLDAIGRCGGGEAVGETQNRPFQLSFNSSLKVDFQGSRVTSDGGLVLVRELDERLRMSELVDRHLSDSRRGKNIQLPLADLLRQSIYSRLAGYEDVNDDARLSQDTTFRLIGSRKIWERGAALTSRLQSFETEVLTQADNGVDWTVRHGSNALDGTNTRLRLGIAHCAEFLIDIPNYLGSLNGLSNASISHHPDQVFRISARRTRRWHK